MGRRRIAPTYPVGQRFPAAAGDFGRGDLSHRLNAHSPQDLRHLLCQCVRLGCIGCVATHQCLSAFRISTLSISGAFGHLLRSMSVRMGRSCGPGSSRREMAGGDNGDRAGRSHACFLCVRVAHGEGNGVSIREGAGVEARHSGGHARRQVEGPFDWRGPRGKLINVGQADTSVLPSELPDATLDRIVPGIMPRLLVQHEGEAMVRRKSDGRGPRLRLESHHTHLGSIGMDSREDAASDAASCQEACCDDPDCVIWQWKASNGTNAVRGVTSPSLSARRSPPTARNTGVLGWRLLCQEELPEQLQRAMCDLPAPRDGAQAH